jgi:hypothetical protein
VRAVVARALGRLRRGSRCHEARRSALKPRWFSGAPRGIERTKPKSM